MVDSKSIYDEDYFEPAEEDALAVVTIANFSLWVVNKLVKIITTHLKSKAVLIDYDKMVANGIPENVAKRETAKSVNFLIQHRYVSTDITKSSTVVKYTDLTEDGKQFIDKYFMRLGKIDEFTIKKAVEAKSKTLETASTVNDFVSILLNVIMSILGQDVFGVIMTLYDGFDMGGFINGFLAKISKAKNTPKEKTE